MEDQPGLQKKEIGKIKLPSFLMDTSASVTPHPTSDNATTTSTKPKPKPKPKLLQKPPNIRKFVGDSNRNSQLFSTKNEAEKTPETTDGEISEKDEILPLDSSMQKPAQFSSLPLIPPIQQEVNNGTKSTIDDNKTRSLSDSKHIENNNNNENLESNEKLEESRNLESPKSEAKYDLILNGTTYMPCQFQPSKEPIPSKPRRPFNMTIPRVISEIMFGELEKTYQLEKLDKKDTLIESKPDDDSEEYYDDIGSEKRVSDEADPYELINDRLSTLKPSRESTDSETFDAFDKKKKEGSLFGPLKTRVSKTWNRMKRRRHTQGTLSSLPAAHSAENLVEEALGASGESHHSGSGDNVESCKLLARLKEFGLTDIPSGELESATVKQAQKKGDGQMLAVKSRDMVEIVRRGDGNPPDMLLCRKFFNKAKYGYVREDNLTLVSTKPNGSDSERLSKEDKRLSVSAGDIRYVEPTRSSSSPTTETQLLKAESGEIYEDIVT